MLLTKIAADFTIENYLQIISIGISKHNYMNLNPLVKKNGRQGNIIKINLLVFVS